MEMEYRRTLSSLDDMTADELNAAIDNTNFPKSTSAASTPLDPNIVSQALGLGSVNGTPTTTAPLNDTIEQPTKSNDESSNGEALASSIAGVSLNGTAKGIIKREHPTPLRMVSFREDKFDVPGTPRTPRTSTTPGIVFCFMTNEENADVVFRLILYC